MSRLVRLYPATWRLRYEAELLDLLEQRPMTPRQAIDLVRGALDAHLHPSIFGREPQPWTHRLPGLLAAAAGLVWSWSVLAFAADHGLDVGEGVGVSIMIMFVSVPGDYAMAYGRRILAGLGAAGAAIVLAQALPWSTWDGQLKGSVAIAAYLILGSGMVTLAAIRAAIGPTTRWVIVVAAILAPATLAVPVLFGLGGPSPHQLTLLAISLPYGVAWTLIGLRMMMRGVVTLADVPGIPVAPEVAAR
jgi:hypothetical protein